MKQLYETNLLIEHWTMPLDDDITITQVLWLISPDYVALYDQKISLLASSIGYK